MATFCPSCGAGIKKDDQKYCQDCGTTLPDLKARNLPAVRGQHSLSGIFGGGTNAVDAQSGTILGIVPDTLKNRMLMYAGGFVVAVVAVWVVVSWIVHILISLIPIFIVLALAFAAIQYWRSRER
jgi:Flp pilus assembly protein TadB